VGIRSESLTTVGSIRYAYGMAPPTRASSVSTKIVGFRLTEEEVQRLDQLVQDLGHKDRSSLLRTWLAQSGPVPRMADDASSHSARAKIIEAPANSPQPTNEIATAHSSHNDEPPEQATPSGQLNPYELIASLRILIQREKDPGTGLSGIPNVVRALLPRSTIERIYLVMGLLVAIGALQLHPKGSAPLSSEDEVVCPCDAEGTVFSHMQWMGKG